MHCIKDVILRGTHFPLLRSGMKKGTCVLYVFHTKICNFPPKLDSPFLINHSINIKNKQAPKKLDILLIEIAIPGGTKLGIFKIYGLQYRFVAKVQLHFTPS